VVIFIQLVQWKKHCKIVDINSYKMKIILIYSMFLFSSCSYSGTNESPLHNVKTFEGKYRKVAEKIISEDTTELRILIQENNLNVNFKDKNMVFLF